MTDVFIKQLCVVGFPDAFPTTPLPHSKALYGGWGVKNKKLFFVNGKRKCRSTLLSDYDSDVFAMNSTALSTDDQPIVLSKGFHCTDLVTALAAPDPTVVAVLDLFWIT